jgi:hypothetical protein
MKTSNFFRLVALLMSNDSLVKEFLWTTKINIICLEMFQVCYF